MSGAIIVPEPEVFPREVRNYVWRLRHDLDAALQRGDLLQARGFRLSLEIQAIFWIDVPGVRA